MNFFGVIFQRNDVVVTETEYNHEKIHLKYMQEMLWIPFTYGMDQNIFV